MFLSLDHIKGGGTKEREQTGMMGKKLYKLLLKTSVDSKYQVLCYNCNLAKGNRKECPHAYMDKVKMALSWEPKKIVKRDRKF